MSCQLLKRFGEVEGGWGCEPPHPQAAPALALYKYGEKRINSFILSIYTIFYVHVREGVFVEGWVGT